jgi:amidohydrolase
MKQEEAIVAATEAFYYLHRHPEPSGREEKTTAYLRKRLEENGVTVLDVPLQTGLVAVTGTGQGPVLAFRCDIDALPMEEKTGLPYASEVPGCMHACGHDFHAASLLGVALTDEARQIPATVRLIFQPAEENATGAQEVLRTGILDDVQAIFGLHCSAAFPRGTVITRPGPMNGAADTYRVTFHGRGSHACRPFLAADPLLMMTRFVEDLQTIVSRHVDPFHPVIACATHLECGTTANIIPDTGFVEGTVRTMDPEDRRLAEEWLRKLASTAAASFGGTADVGWQAGPPATANRADLVKLALDTARAMHLPVAEPPDSLSAEDFAYYQERLPGCFIQMGTGLSHMNHHPEFHVDPAALLDSIPYTIGLLQRAAAYFHQRQEETK